MRSMPAIILSLLMVIPFSASNAVGIDNGEIALQFRDGDFGLERIDGAGFSLGFDADYPLWVVELYDPSAATLASDDLLPLDSRFAAPESWELSAEGDTLSLDWRDIDLGGMGLLDFTMRVVLRAGEGTARFYSDLSLDSDTLSVWAVNAPRWKLHESYGGLHIDRAALPTQGGCLVENPAETLRADYSKAMDLAPDRTGHNCTLPGGLCFQQTQLYDGESLHGLLFGTEDADGWMKRIGNLGVPEEAVVRTRFRHILRQDGATVLSWSQPYAVFVQPFTGDWVAGARAYRARVEGMP